MARHLTRSPDSRRSAPMFGAIFAEVLVSTAVLIASAVVTVAALSADAYACSPELPPSYVLDSTLPAAGQRDVPRNSGLRFLAVEALSNGPLNGHGGFEIHELTVTALSTATAIDGRLIPWGGAPIQRLWVPNQPLPPNTEFEVRATTGPWSPAEQDSLTTHVFSFETSERVFPELQLTDELEMQLEMFEADVIGPECHAPCSVIPSCTSGKTTALRAVVTAPVVSGGNESAGYSASLIYTRNVAPVLEELGQGFTPGSIQGQQRTLLGPGKAWSTQQRLHEAEGPYAPCFTLQVWDSGGQSVVQSKCFAAVDVKGILADVADDAKASLAATSETSAKDDAPTKSADVDAVDSYDQPATCAASGIGSSSRTAWGLVAVVALACSRRRRRFTANRRQRRARAC